MRQRAMIAMGLVTNPALILADEPTTALDVTVQAEILDLLRTINREHGTAIVFVSHDIAVISAVCSRIAVMYAGRIVEELSVHELLQGTARHPYTRALMSTVVDLDTDVDSPLAIIPGKPPALGDAGAGCPFAPRCPYVLEQCVKDPPLEAIGEGKVACWVAGRDRQPADSGETLVPDTR
jgi:oligopeptide/dipeptide ABC transporter ATP-binding protein